MYEDLNYDRANKQTQSIFELDSDVEKYGGLQKFVLLKVNNNYIIGSLPNLSHTETIKKMQADNNTESFGGSSFDVYKNIITINTSSFSSKIGPIRIPFLELREIMQNVVGDKYIVKLSE